MPTYDYVTSGGDGTGKEQRGTVTADTDAEAEEKVRVLYKYKTEIIRLSIISNVSTQEFLEKGASVKVEPWPSLSGDKKN